MTRNEFEFAEGFQIKDNKSGQNLVTAYVRSDIVRKINICTLRYRPKCAYTGAICGLKWYKIGDNAFCQQAYL